METTNEGSTDKFLQYQVYKWSSYSSKYFPANILHNKPNQQSSRWSSATNNPPQFLILKLTKPAIVRKIVFGKYEKTHVCNLKKFKILGGMEENNLIEVLQGGLRNDHHAETFALKHKINEQVFPCKYIKIVPILSWGQSFNFSIWYIELQGLNSEECVQSRLQWYYKHREREAVRLCLKHFRQHNYTDAFESLQKKTKICLEHPLLTELHNELVKNGNFEECERLITEALSEGLFENYVNKQEYQAHWESVQGRGDENIPCKRGGHQMCFDHCKNEIYLFGGWDGLKDLSDLWKFDVSMQNWLCLSADTEQDDGPSPRSCHKICMDCENGKIYTLGRYLDSAKRSPQAVRNEFRVYDTNMNKWSLISADTAQDNGPRLLFDHQMCIDTEHQTIYVFGGRIITASLFPTQNERQTIEFSGLYRYDIPSNTWHLLREDSGNAGPQDIRSRNGHSMLFDKKNRLLFVIGGQRGKEYLNDFFVYDIEKDSVRMIYDGTHKEGCGLPPPGFTQRASINYDLGEIHVLVGLSKDKDKQDEHSMHNSLWVYNIALNTWICFYTNDPSSNTNRMLQSRSTLEPCPRFAHQLVYNHVTKTHFMFGGNPGNRANKQIRLNDFWRLKIFRLRGKDILRKCRYMIRCHQFKEMAINNPMEAIGYLQTKLYDIVNHENAAESHEFRRLACYLFGSSPDENEREIMDKNSSSLFTIPTSSNNALSLSNLLYTDVEEAYAGRTKLYDVMVSFFPEEMVQPRENLVDLITF